MKVLLVGNYAADGQHSMQGFAGVLYAELARIGINARLLSPRAIAARGKSHGSASDKWMGYLDKYMLFVPELRRAIDWADVVHVCDQGNALYVHHLRRKPHLVTCHDLLAIRSALNDLDDWKTGRTGRLYQHLILGGLKRARFIACVSEETRRELLHIAGVSPVDTALVHNGLYHDYAPMEAGRAVALLAQLSLPETWPFLLHVGGNQPYKNRLGLLRIFAALRGHVGMDGLNLVLAGRPITAEMQEFIEENGLQACVRTLTDVSNEQLRALYTRARALVFPSLYEGFGMPIIEAQACGCPVFTSDRAPMTEVGGGAAVYIDPAQPEQAARVLAERLPETQSLVAAGFENVERFTTDNMLCRYVEIYKRLVGGRCPTRGGAVTD